MTPEDTTEILKRRVRDLMNEKGIRNSYDFERVTGITSATIRRMLDTGSASIHTLKIIANALDVSVDYMIGLSDFPHGNNSEIMICSFCRKTEYAVKMKSMGRLGKQACPECFSQISEIIDNEVDVEKEKIKQEYDKKLKTAQQQRRFWKN